MFNRKTITGSFTGGIKAQEEVLELCAKHNILPETETVLADKIDWVFE
jgi:alcohol dehydrogenase (NADP+)